MNSLNHQQWLETVPENLKHIVSDVIRKWNDNADEFNQWDELGWDERDNLLNNFNAI